MEMKMTEEEAKTKWCPMVRLEGQYEGETACNRSYSGDIADAAKCIASNCMMWIGGPYERLLAQDCDGFTIKKTGHCSLAK